MSMGRDISINKVKVMGVVVVSVLLLFIPVSVFNHYVVHLKHSLAFLIISAPLISLCCCIAAGGGLMNIGSTITLIKFWRPFPALFYLDTGPRFHRYKQMDVLEPLLQKGDILLRRHDNYLDGLILQQTGYFTHAGLYYGDGEGKQMIHAIGSKGVAYDSLAEFARCDDLMVLRLKAPGGSSAMSQQMEEMVEFITRTEMRRKPFGDLLLEPEWQGSGTWDNEHIEVNDMRQFITGGDAATLLSTSISEELMIYDQLQNNRMLSPAAYIPVILKTGRAVLGRPYDFDFNFVNFEKLSCIEFVWYAYKCAYPLHQVKRRPYRYFSFVNTFVIVPDDFVESEAFEVVYNSINRPFLSKKDLVSYMSKHKLNFWWFLVRLISTQLILLYIIGRLLQWLIV